MSHPSPQCGCEVCALLKKTLATFESRRSESETRCPMCEKVIREDDLYEDGCPFCGTYIDSGNHDDACDCDICTRGDEVTL